MTDGSKTVEAHRTPKACPVTVFLRSTAKARGRQSGDEMGIFKPCDIRGVVGEQWDTPEARRIGEGLGRLLTRRGEKRVFVGGDFRRSTPRLKAALIEGLRRSGVSVCDLGQLPTPAVYFAARQYGCPNVAVVTASHNPAQYNGVKLMVAGQPGVPKLLEELKEEYEQLGSMTPPGSRADCESLDVVPEYERWIIPTVRQFVDQGLRRTGRSPLGDEDGVGQVGTVSDAAPERFLGDRRWRTGP
ncbi:MAG TPA: hypothetical protein EYP14_14420, partial [Planctomycetaceae bacterium]|nr:hypothetical protein [Planctomycetaceae bacterium]